MIRMLLQSGYTVPEMIIYGLIFMFVLVFSLSIHEVMHGYVAYKMGDDTARLQGRLTLNPLVHLDPIGTLMMAFAGFGWAKPVPVNYNRLTKFKNRFISIRLVSLAGITANFAVAFVSYLLFTVISIIAYKANIYNITDTLTTPGLGVGATLLMVIQWLMFYLYSFNLMLMAFNLLPFPPLDGYHFLETFLPYKVKQKIQPYERYFGMALFALIIIGNLTDEPILSTLIDIISTPFNFLIITPINFLFLLIL